MITIKDLGLRSFNSERKINRIGLVARGSKWLSSVQKVLFYLLPRAMHKLKIFSIFSLCPMHIFLTRRNKKHWGNISMKLQRIIIINNSKTCSVSYLVHKDNWWLPRNSNRKKSSDEFFPFSNLPSHKTGPIHVRKRTSIENLNLNK